MDQEYNYGCLHLLVVNIARATRSLLRITDSHGGSSMTNTTIRVVVASYRQDCIYHAIIASRRFADTIDKVCKCQNSSNVRVFLLERLHVDTRAEWHVATPAHTW